MKFAIRIPFQGRAGADDVARVVTAADEAGLDSGWLGDHLCFPVGEVRSRYPGTKSGSYMKSFDEVHLDPWCTLAYAAANSSRIGLGTGVTVLPYRHPIIVAKAVATVDHLSGGRAILGVALGWVQEEFEALGISFSSRVGRLEEGIAALRALFETPTPEFHGEHFDFGPVYFSPKPVHGRVPIIIGANTEAARRRAGMLGDGFYGSRLPLEATRVAAREARAAHADSPRHEQPFTVLIGYGVAFADDPPEAKTIVGPLEGLRDTALRYEDAGADMLMLDTQAQRADDLLKVIEVVAPMVRVSEAPVTG